MKIGKLWAFGLLAFLAASLLLLSGCLGLAQKDASGNCIGSCPFGMRQPASNECACVPDDWNSWEAISVLLVLILIFVMALLYIIATSMEMPYLQVMLRDEFVQAIISFVFVFLLASFLWTAHNYLLPGLASTFKFAPDDLPAVS
ncbi:Uncharacterised protein [Candidatus Burarchaeum australiense]|nr:Uncharacterised protein [Candidatus Burarchaeum australiense]